MLAINEHYLSENINKLDPKSCPKSKRLKELPEKIHLKIYNIKTRLVSFPLYL